MFLKVIVHIRLSPMFMSVAHGLVMALFYIHVACMIEFDVHDCANSIFLYSLSYVHINAETFRN